MTSARVCASASPGRRCSVRQVGSGVDRTPSRRLAAALPDQPKPADGSAAQPPPCATEARADWELVLKRNPVERLKREKAPLGIRGRAPGADRGRLRGGPGGGHRPPPVVGPLPRQAEDRHVHAADQAPERAPDAREAARDRRDLEPLRPRRRRALDAPERPAPLARARARCPDVFAAPRRGRADDRRRLRRHRPQHHRLPGRRASTADELFDCRPSSRRRPSSSTATPTTATCRASTRSRSRPAPTAATRRRSTASRSSASCTTGDEGFAVRVGGGLSSVPRHRAATSASSCPKDEAIDVLRALHRRLEGGPPLPRLAREGAPQVHGRRLRRRGDARAGRGAARPRRSTTSSSPPRPSRRITSASTRRSSPGSSTSASPCTSG